MVLTRLIPVSLCFLLCSLFVSRARCQDSTSSGGHAYGIIYNLGIIPIQHTLGVEFLVAHDFRPFNGYGVMADAGFIEKSSTMGTAVEILGSLHQGGEFLYFTWLFGAGEFFPRSTGSGFTYVTFGGGMSMEVVRHLRFGLDFRLNYNFAPSLSEALRQSDATFPLRLAYYW